MPVFLSVVPLLLAAAAFTADGERPATTAVSIDGGEVPIVAAKITPGVASVLAPELASDGGVTSRGDLSPIVAPTTLSVYRVDLPAETAITAAALGLYVMVEVLVKPSLQGDLSCRNQIGTARCDPADLSPFDRYAVGKNSKPWKDFSDAAVVSALLLPALYLGLESLALPTREPWGDFARDLLVITESLALTAAMQEILKFSFRRPRPDRYLAVDVPTDFDSELSLPSGHVAMVSAATTALTTTIFLRHPESKVRFFALALGVVFSGLTAISRVESGQHFPTDSITGLLIGGFAGFVVPYLHRNPSRLVPSVAFNPVSGATMFAVTGAM